MNGCVLVLAAAWMVACLTAVRYRWFRLGAVCCVLAAVHVAARLWPPAIPLVAAAWLGYGLFIPSGRRWSVARTVIAGVATAALAGWVVVLAPDGRAPASGALVGTALAVAAVAGIAVAVRCRRARTDERSAIQWLAAAAVLAVAADLVLLALHVLVSIPDSLGDWLIASLVLIPLAQALAAWPATTRGGESALVEAIVVAGLACLVAAVYLVVVVGLNRAPEQQERDILMASIAAALVVAVLALPVRQRLSGFATELVGRREASAEEVVATFGARMSRAVPMDELMLQLAESLKATIAPAGAEIWVGADGVLTRTISVPTVPSARITLDPHERVVVGRARIGGPSWSSVWLPALVQQGHLRVAPVAHLGQLLGLIVARRGMDAADYTDDEDRQLVDLARQLGLALHNVRLDSALQASLEELEQRNAELQASRLRIVTASDESRRAIERNLHDGAQQHLVALAVKLGLARQIAEDDPETVLEMLEQLRDDVRTTIAELRELAHGIYPPLLRDRGLGEALRTAATRCPLPCTVDVELPGRFAVEAETAAYFCCLEALQNAGKYAGDGATVQVRVTYDDAALHFAVQDDGVGFEVGTAQGHGFLNMQDRLGAIGGELCIESAPGRGTTVRGSIPVTPLNGQTTAVPRADDIATGAPEGRPADSQVAPSEIVSP